MANLCGVERRSPRRVLHHARQAGQDRARRSRARAARGRPRRGRDLRSCSLMVLSADGRSQPTRDSSGWRRLVPAAAERRGRGPAHDSCARSGRKPAVASRSAVRRRALVRGMGYYTGPIFEAALRRLRRVAIAGGGRYDRMVGRLLGQDVPACGFSIGFERVVSILEEQERARVARARPDRVPVRAATTR